MAPLLCALLLAAASPQSFMITWSGRDSAAMKAAGQSASFWGETLGNMIGQQLDAKFPCGSTMDQAAAAVILDNERKRQLLGAGDHPEVLVALAGAVGARTIIHITVTMTGSNPVVKVFALDSVTAKTIANRVEEIPLDDNPDFALKSLAAQFAGSLAGSVPKCRGRDWAGNVTIVYAAKGKSGDGKVVEDGSGTLSCALSGDDGAAKCTYNSTYSMQGRGGTVTWTKSAKVADVTVSASLTGDKLKLEVGTMRVMTSFTGPGVNSEPYPEDLRADSFEVPAGPDPNRQSGSYSPPALGNAKVTITWSLSKPAPGVR